jgi:uncharacterized membrane protein YcaP (DUF421 family)
MESLLSVDLEELFSLSVSPAELIIRGTAMYWFLFLLFRFVVRRDAGSVGLADMLIIVIVADASQNAMSGEYETISDGMILVATLIGWNVLLDWLSFRFVSVRHVIQPPPLLLVKHGRLIWRNMRREFISEAELTSKLREAGIDSLSRVKEAYMEADGQISFIEAKE